MIKAPSAVGQSICKYHSLFRLKHAFVGESLGWNPMSTHWRHSVTLWGLPLLLFLHTVWNR